MTGMNNMTIDYQGSPNVTPSSGLLNNTGNIQATRGTGPNIRTRQLSGPLQISPNPMLGQLQHPSNSHGILTNRTSTVQQGGMHSNQNTLVISRTSQNLQQMQIQPSNLPGSNYVQVPSHQLPPPQPPQLHVAQLPPQASPHQQQHQQQPQNVAGQSLLQQLLSE